MRWIWSRRTRSCATKRETNPVGLERLRGPYSRTASRTRLRWSRSNPRVRMSMSSSERRTGVGGGEYRAPVLLALLGRVRWAIAANLLIGLCVAVFNVVFRQAWTLDLDLLWLALLFVPTSLPGAFVGALVTRRISTKALKGLLAGILVATGLRLILFEVRAGGTLSFGPLQIGLGLLLGFGLGILSGLLGVAGGEYRIPAFVLLFGVPTVFAGTLSSLASIPLQLMGFWKHRNLGHTGAATFRLGALMGFVSVVGVALGVLFLGRATEALVTQVLGLA